MMSMVFGFYFFNPKSVIQNPKYKITAVCDCPIQLFPEERRFFVSAPSRDTE